MALSPDFVISKASLENHILGTDWPCGCDEEAACSPPTTMGQGPGYSIALTKVTCLTCGSAENDFQLECSLYATEASQPDSLHLAQCNLVLCSVVKFGCSGLVSRHLLGVLQPSVVLQVNGDAGCPPGVTSNGGEKAGRLGPLSNRSPGVVPVKSSSGHCRSSRINALEQGLAALKACGLNVLVQDLLEQMMHWHFVLLAAFFVESQPSTRAIMIVIVDFEFQYCAHTGEAVEHRWR